MKNALKITGLFTFLAVAFLNAFVDLGHKIIIQNTIFKNYDGSELIVLTSIVNALILLPFILLFTPTGYISRQAHLPEYTPAPVQGSSFSRV